ncbi:MAG: STAS domain-containing protein [Leptospiraceae bacterium]|nr:STAS domain-containing protein [Leptospiraceae bacterium]MDW7974950.1 STAS domain-containing protein [Leptospiraceae bacterium]
MNEESKDFSNELFKAYRLQNFLIVEPHIRLDLSFADNFYNQLIEHLTSEPSNVIIDMKYVPYVSSSGIKMFLKMKRYLDARGYQFGVCNLSKEVYKILHISELQNLIPIFQDLNEAMEYLNR